MSDWYYAVGGEQKGPINESELKANFATHSLPADTLVWKDGMESWTAANLVPAFSFRAPPSPAKLQPPATVIASATTVNNPASVMPVTTADLVGTPEALEVNPDDAEKNKIFGILAYIGILCLVPIFAAKDSPFAKYHANQGLVLFLAEIVLWIGVAIMNAIFMMVLPGSLSFLVVILDLLELVPLALVVLGIINAAQGKCVPLPLIGGVKLLK